MKIELKEEEVNFILRVLAETKSWKSVNDLIHKISEQTEKPKK